MKNFPTEYDRFIKLAKNINETQYKRKKTVNSLTRVAQRYNLAKSFQGMNVDGIGKNTVLGYDVITKLFLSYCAYELTHDTARILLNSPKHETIRTINLTPIFGDDVTVKALQTNLKLKTFLLKVIIKCEIILLC